MKKSEKTKNYRSHDEWMIVKKIGRPKQRWVPFQFGPVSGRKGYWEKI